MQKSNLSFVASWLALPAFLVIASAGAAVPESISYQGYLTDRFGTPNNETLHITFSIYNVPAGGSPLWSEVQTVPMFQGLFTLELGNTSNPFPVGLFDTPLWLGMTIEDDSEMSPRRPLTSVGFAFKADDAISLQGLTPASLDQSEHVDDVGNPHGVSTAQIGAASDVALVAHVGNASNPHMVTPADTGSAHASDFVLHTGDVAAHHVRYSDTEAVASMGGQSDTNALNHAKYQDAMAFSAVLAADGDGSGLDADLVDGLDATEIIQSAIQSTGRQVLDANGEVVGTIAGYYDNNGGNPAPSLVVNVDYQGFRGVMLMPGADVNDNYLSSFPRTFTSSNPNPVYLDGSCVGGNATAISSLNNAQIASGFVHFENQIYAIDTSTTVNFVGTYLYQGGGCSGGNLDIDSSGFQLVYLGEMALPLAVQ